MIFFLKEHLKLRHLMPLQNGNLTALMNGPIKKKLKIIPHNVIWGGKHMQGTYGDLMKQINLQFRFINQD